MRKLAWFLMSIAMVPAFAAELVQEDRETLEQLLAIPSVSSDAAACDRAVDLMRGYLEAHGVWCAVETLPADGRRILYAATERNLKTPDFTLVTHLDVVPAPESQFSPRYEGKRLFARGACDTKANAFCAAMALVRNNGTRRFGCVFASDEEIGGHTTERLIELGYAVPRRGVIVMDGGDVNLINVGSKGNANYRVIARGKPGHSSAPKNGDNPIYKLAEAAIKIRDRYPFQKPGEWGSVASVTVMDCGDVVNRIPGTAEMLVNVRFTDPENGLEIRRKLLEEITGLEVELIDGTPAAVGRLDDPETLRFQRIQKRIFPERKNELKYNNASNDSRWFGKFGKALMSIGPNARGAHTDREFCEPDSFSRVVDALTALFEDEGAEAAGASADSGDKTWHPIGNRKARVVHWGVIHNHSAGKWEAVLKLTNDYEMVGWVDDTSSKAMRMAEPKKSRYQKYPSFTPQQVFDEVKPDLIVVETANSELVEVSTEIARHGIPMHMDKPLGIDQKGFRKMSKICETQGVPLQIGYMFRANEAINRMVEIAKSGALGEIYSVECDLDHNYGYPKYPEYATHYPGGTAYLLACHAIEWAMPIFNDELPMRTHSILKPAPGDPDWAVTHSLTIMEYPRANVVIRVCSKGTQPCRHIRIDGTEGTMELEPIEDFRTVKHTTGLNEGLAPVDKLEIRLFLKRVNDTAKAAGFVEGLNRLEFQVPKDRYAGQLQELARILRGEIPNPPGLYEHDLKVHKVSLDACNLKTE